MTYKQLINQALKLYFDKEYEKAYDLVTEHMDKVTGNMAQLYNFRYSFLAVQGKTEEAFALLHEAVMDKGFWYPSELLLNDHDLKALRSHSGFKKLLKRCEKLEDQAYREGEYRLQPIEPLLEDRSSASLFIGLHGDQENAEIAAEDWSFIKSPSVQLAVMQSAEMQLSDGYIWEDVHAGAMALKEFTDNLKPVFKEIAIGGFSAGARVALWAVIGNEVKVKSLVLVAPWLPEVKEWFKSVGFDALKDLELTIIIGEEDDDCLEGASLLHEFLQEEEIEHQFIKIAGLMHDFPENLASLI